MSTTDGPTDDVEGCDAADEVTSRGGPDRGLAPHPGPEAMAEPGEDAEGTAVEQSRQSQQ